MKRLAAWLTIFVIGQTYSQDIIGSYINTKRVSTNTYSFDVYIFADASLNLARPTITVNFGDGDSATFNLINSSGSGNTILKKYSGTHTYASPGLYQAWHLDKFRVPNIKNMSSSQTQKIASTTYIAINNFSQYNTSPILTQLPTDLSSSGNQFFFNAGFSDDDGDSLSYSLVNCYGSNYYTPSNATVDPVSGTFGFADSVGLYVFSIKISEWRKNFSNQYTVIGTTQMEFTINMAGAIGLPENDKQMKNVFVYPNPATNIINISCNAADNNTVQILNSIGQCVLVANQADKINIADLPNGIYFIKTNSQTCKFIKR
jgi:hypothetical protein